MAYTIDDSVPIPEVETIPYTEMQVGQSIELPLEKRAGVQSYISRLKARTGMVFTIKKVSEGKMRIWRVK